MIKLSTITSSMLLICLSVPALIAAESAKTEKKTDLIPSKEAPPKEVIQIPYDSASIISNAVQSMSQGARYLLAKQDPNGSWSDEPAITALCLMGLQRAPTPDLQEACQAAIQKARIFILQHVQEDGSIWLDSAGRGYPTYSTAICLTALAMMNQPEDRKVILAAREFLLGCQYSENREGKAVDSENSVYGGFGYGKGAGKANADLSNTQWVLEALYVTESIDAEKNEQGKSDVAVKEDKEKSDLAWKNAMQFVSRLQHLPETNDRVWVVQDKEKAEKDNNHGGFIYRPVDDINSPNAAKSLRSYGSMTYAGLKSMIYAKLKKDDPRVKAAVEWARRNYTLEENPGVGKEGLFYYLVTFSKAYSALEDEYVVTPDGQRHQWRLDLLKTLPKFQKAGGEWVNDAGGRWMESVPELVTAYAMISLNIAMPKNTKAAIPTQK